MAAADSPQRHNDHLRGVLLLRTDLAFFFLGFVRSSPCCRCFICSLISSFRLLAADNTSSGSLSWSSPVNSRLCNNDSFEVCDFARRQVKRRFFKLYRESLLQCAVEYTVVG